MSPAGIAALLALALVPVSSGFSLFWLILASAFLRPLAPRRYAAPLLGYYGRSDLCRARLSANKRPRPRLSPAGFPASCPCPSDHSVPTHVPCPTRLFLRSSLSTGHYLWLRVTQSRLGLRSPLAGSPSTVPPYRVRHPTDWPFTSVAPHAGFAPAQSLRLPGDELLPEADLHRPGRATRRRTSAPVLGRSNVGKRRRCDEIGRVSLSSACCARGRARSKRTRIRARRAGKAPGKALTCISPIWLHLNPD